MGIDPIPESFIELRDDPPILRRVVWHDLAVFFTIEKDKVEQARNNFTLLASFTNLKLEQKHSAKLFSALVRANITSIDAEAIAFFIIKLSLKQSTYLTEYFESTEVESAFH